MHKKYFSTAINTKIRGCGAGAPLLGDSVPESPFTLFVQNNENHQNNGIVTIFVENG